MAAARGICCPRSISGRRWRAIVQLPVDTAEPPQGLPHDAGDPRLQGWYHTIDLGEGLASRGMFDHRPIVDRYGLPASLAGKTALDVGSFDGFWAFELERRGAARVVAADVPTLGHFDWLPAVRRGLGERANLRSHFDLAHAMRRSKVEHRVCNVYEMSPETIGTFDVVFCGDLLLHLWNPFEALVNLHAITRELAVVSTTVDQAIETLHPAEPWLRFGFRQFESSSGIECTYWLFSTKSLEEMMLYAGFRTVEAQGLVQIPGGPLATAVVGRV